MTFPMYYFSLEYTSNLIFLFIYFIKMNPFNTFFNCTLTSYFDFEVSINILAAQPHMNESDTILTRRGIGALNPTILIKRDIRIAVIFIQRLQGLFIIF